MYITEKMEIKIRSVALPEGEFPKSQFDQLNKFGCSLAIIPEAFGGKGLGMGQNTTQLLQLLKTIGSIDLSLGRIFEGHFNALQLIFIHGSETQKANYFNKAAMGEIFGVWNTNDSGLPVLLEESSEEYVLSGKKIFCSGGLSIQNALITSYSGGVPQLIVVHLKDLEMESEEKSSWNPMGMRGSVSTTIDFSNCRVVKDQLIGNPGDYFTEPFFSTGSIRFAAVQLGGAEALAQCAIEHLIKMNRHGDAIQKTRLASVAILLESGNQWIHSTGNVMDDDTLDPKYKVSHANMVRSAILNICNEIMNLSEKSVGLQSALSPHKMERLHRDLLTYLKQPGPDQALQAIGQWIFETGFWSKKSGQFNLKKSVKPVV